MQHGQAGNGSVVVKTSHEGLPLGGPQAFGDWTRVCLEG